MMSDGTMAQATHTECPTFYSQAILCGVYGEHRDTETGYCPITACQYYSTSAPYSFVYYRHYLISANVSVVE